MAIKQTAGRDALGEFAPKFAELNDDVLFGQVWSREDKLSLRDRSLVTVTALMAQGLVDNSFRYHLESARKNGITREEIAEALVQGLGGIYYGQRSLEGRGIKHPDPFGENSLRRLTNSRRLFIMMGKSVLEGETP